MSSTFAQLGVPSYIVDALARRGITETFEIQAATLPDALAGRDVCGRAPTGSGKTLAFGIPLVTDLQRAKSGRPRALVLAPTRELAEQISTELITFAGQTRVATVYGGVGYKPQLTALRRGVEVLVACPGRLEDLIEQGAVELSSVERVVVDEADRMADMGFIPAVRRLLDQTSPHRQTMLFSATLDGDVAELTERYQRKPARHEVGLETPDISEASHTFWKVDKAERAKTTAKAVDAASPAIVFCRTRHGADRLSKQLTRLGIRTAAIHGGRTQNQRTKALDSFVSGRVQALVATDVAARGIHVDGVATVVHFDPPEDGKTYVHRSGRTARAGSGGHVVSLLQPEQLHEAKQLKRKLGLEQPITNPDATQLGEATEPRSSAKPHETSSARPDRRSGAQQRKKRHSRKKRPANAAAATAAPASDGPPQPNRKARRAHLQRPGAR